MRRDINLIPRKNAGPKQSKSLVLIILVAVFYVIALLLAVIIPNSIKNGFVIIDDQLNLQIEQLQPQVDEYNDLLVELQNLQIELDSSSSLNFSKFNAIDALNIIEKTCPSNVRIKSLKNDETTLVIDIVAEDNYQVAQFALELERTGYFTRVNISDSTPETIRKDETEIADSGSGVTSSIYLAYDLSDPVEEETENTEDVAPDDTSQEGGN